MYIYYLSICVPMYLFIIIYLFIYLSICSSNWLTIYVSISIYKHTQAPALKLQKHHTRTSVWGGVDPELQALNPQLPNFTLAPRIQTRSEFRKPKP